MGENPILYFDNAATTRLHPSVLQAMMPYLEDCFGNPSGVYGYARTAKKAVEAARRQVAAAINASPEEIVFTSGGTESDNWALKGVAERMRDRGRHIITTAIEHHAVKHTCEYLEKQGFEVTYLPVDSEGFVSPATLEKAIRPDTILVSIMLANNEVGTIQPIAEIGAITRSRGIYLHTDAVQAAGHIPVDVEALQVDLLTLSAHKFYGPKGIGALYIRKGVRLNPVLHGGAQESSKRAGTEYVAGIVGMGEAITLAVAEMPEESKRLTLLRDKLIKGIEDTIPFTYLNGPRENRLPGNVNFSFDFVEGESILLYLDTKGCYASTGSACSSGSLDPSHVLMALGIPHGLANGTLRFSMGRYTTESDVDALLALLPPMITRLLELSPLYEDYKASL
ncbi:cysteine desulfurylase family member [Holotrichia oblita]|uniref:Cysteine desulfurylase family member n=1 Tax=Holotrichia oblita TaxID=644536 RepID=A0ACB9T4C8_HOLOL|nr:cysteine desulfurylase family member [Holotrichia oblita]